MKILTTLLALALSNIALGLPTRLHTEGDREIRTKHISVTPVETILVCEVQVLKRGINGEPVIVRGIPCKVATTIKGVHELPSKRIDKNLL